MISRIQSQRSECAPESWSPVVRARPGHPPGCLEGDSIKGGNVSVPESLGGGGLGTVEEISSRSPDNDIIVYWTHPDDTYGEATGLPSDGAICWLYVSDLGAWTESYHRGEKDAPES